MTVDRAELQQISPDDIARYLSAAGWTEAGSFRQRATIWRLAEREAEVLVPLSTEFRDYPQRTYDVVRALADLESRPESEVLRSLTDAGISAGMIGPHVDQQHFRLFPDAPTGMLSAADAAEAFTGIRELLVAAAYGEYYPNDALTVLPNSKPRDVTAFPEKALLTTGPGSFVITSSVPMSADSTLFNANEPYTRRVVLRLRTAVAGARAAAGAAAETSEITPFAERARDGVSKSLCAGLARLGGIERNRAFELSFGWASSAPVNLPAGPLRFDPEHVAMLAHAAEDLGRMPTTNAAAIVGRVHSLERADPREPGWIVVQGELTVRGVSRNRRVWISLQPDDYDRALRAHGQGLRVRAAGTLTRTGRRAELTASEYFRVL